MQMFFGGNFRGAHSAVSELIEQGQVDARLHYFRGLASYHLGDLDGADSDFEVGAGIEIGDASNAVGQALQRIQGPDRLRLEKHRRMARLRQRIRSQSPAPPLIVAASAEQTLSETVAQTGRLMRQNSDQQTIRLASEVPMQIIEQTNPFVDDPSESLVTDFDPFADGKSETPVGTGVAESFDNRSMGPADDPFSDVGSMATRRVDGAQGNVVGAIFRALGRSIPNMNVGGLMPGFSPPPGDSSAVEIPTKESDPIDSSDESTLGSDPFDDF